MSKCQCLQGAKSEKSYLRIKLNNMYMHISGQRSSQMRRYITVEEVAHKVEHARIQKVLSEGDQL